MGTSAVQPIFAAIEPIAVHCEACSPWCSNTIRTARLRTSGEYFVDAFFVMAPVSQELEPPAIPARFRSRKRFVAADQRGPPCPAATKRLILLQHDFDASDAKVQAGTFGVGSDLHDDTSGILEIPYSTAANQSGTGRGSRIGAREVLDLGKFVNFRGYDIRATANVSQRQTGSGKRVIFILIMECSASPGIAHADCGRSAGEIDSRIRCSFLFLSRNREYSDGSYHGYCYDGARKCGDHAISGHVYLHLL